VQAIGKNVQFLVYEVIVDMDVDDLAHDHVGAARDSGLEAHDLHG
jgi:hypothetical protein